MDEIIEDIKEAITDEMIYHSVRVASVFTLALAAGAVSIISIIGRNRDTHEYEHAYDEEPDNGYQHDEEPDNGYQQRQQNGNQQRQQVRTYTEDEYQQLLREAVDRLQR